MRLCSLPRAEDLTRGRGSRDLLLSLEEEEERENVVLEAFAHDSSAILTRSISIFRPFPYHYLARRNPETRAESKLNLDWKHSSHSWYSTRVWATSQYLQNSEVRLRRILDFQDRVCIFQRENSILVGGKDRGFVGGGRARVEEEWRSQLIGGESGARFRIRLAKHRRVLRLSTYPCVRSAVISKSDFAPPSRKIAPFICTGSRFDEIPDENNPDAC